MAEHDMIASVGIVPEQSSLNQTENVIANSVAKGFQKGAQRGLIQGINANAFSQPLGRITGKANEFEKSMAAANARVIAFGASTAPIFAMGAAFRKLVDSTIEVQRVMTGINAIFGLGASNLRTFTSQLFGVANQTGQSFNMAADAATEFARQGLNVQETLKRTSAALILNKISGLDMGEAVSSITSILNGFSKEALNSTDIINRMTSVDTQFAVSAGDLAEALKRVGASANDANVSFNQTLGLITAARQITGREGSVIGNSFKTMFTRLQRPEVLNDLEEAGIKVRDLNGKILPLVDILKELAGTYNGLAASQKSFVSEAVGGVYQINILKGIMRDLSSGVSIYDNAVNAANNSTSAVTSRMDKLNSTLSAGLVRTMNDLALASSNVGNALMGNSMKQGIGFFDNILQSTINNTNPDNKSGRSQVAQATIKGLGNLLAGPGLQVGFNIILKLLTRLEQFVTSSGKDLLGLDSGSKERETLEKRYLAILSQEKEKIDEIISGKKTLNQMVAATVSLGIQDQKRNALMTVMAKSAASQSLNKGLTETSNTVEIPNLFNPIADALYRENVLTGGNARLSYSPLLIGPNNPYGLAAIDSRTQKDATEAVQQHRTLGQTSAQIKNGSLSIPHLATGIDMSLLLSTFGYAGQLAQSSDKIHKFVNLFPLLFSVTEKEIYAKRKLVDEYDKMSKDLLTSGKSQSFYGSSFNNLSELSASPLAKEMESFRGEIRNFVQKQDSDRKSLLSNGFKIANYSSFGGAALSQALSNVSPTASASADDLQAGITAAGQALIAFPNKIGLALSTGLVSSGIINAFSTLTTGIDNQREAADLELARLKDVNENLRTLSQTSSNLSTLYNDAGTSVETISRESRKYSETLAELSQMSGGAEMARKISLAPSADARQGVIQDLLGEQSKHSETVASLISAQELFAKRSFFGMNHIPGIQSNQGGYIYQNDFEKDTVKSQLIENAGVAISNMSDNFKNALLDSVTDLGQFNKTLGSFSGGGAEDVKSYLAEIKKSGGAPAYDEVIQEIRSLLTEKNLYEKNPEVAKALQTSRSQLDVKQLNIDNATKNQEYIKRLFLNQGSLQSGNLLDVREQALRTSYGSESVRLSGLQSFSPLFAQQNGERTVAQREYGIGIQDLANNTRNQLSSLNVDTNRKLMEQLTQNFDENLAKSTKSGTGPNITGEKNLSISDNRSLLISTINNGLSNVLKENGGDVISKYSNNGQFNLQAFAKAAAQSGTSNPVIESQVEKYLNSQQSIDILKTLNSSNIEQNKILQEFKDKSLEEQQKLNAAIAEADFKQLNSYFGGIQSLLDRGSARTIMREETRGLSLMNNGGSPEAKAQGAGMVLKSLQSQGFKITDDNPLIAKAHQTLVTQGIATYQKYTGRMVGMASGMFGENSPEAVGLSQGYNQDLTQVLENQYKAAFKPEGAAGSETFSNTLEYIKPFNDGLIQSTESLNNFPAAIQTTVDALKNASSGIDDARKSYDATLKQVDKGLEDMMSSLQAKYGEAATPAQPQQQTDYISWTKEFGPAIGTLIATAIGTAINNLIFSKLGGASFKNIIGSFSSKLPKNEAGEISQVAEAVETSDASVVQAINGRTSFNGTHYSGGEAGVSVENGLSADMQMASNSWKNTLDSIGPKNVYTTSPIISNGKALTKYSGKIRIPINNPSSILSDLGQPIESDISGQAPEIRKFIGKITNIPKIISKDAINKALDNLVKEMDDLTSQTNQLVQQYQQNLEKIAQDIHLGKEVNLKSFGKDISGLKNWKGIGKSTILQRLSEMGLSSKSYGDSLRTEIEQTGAEKFNKLSGISSRIDEINAARIARANSINRNVFISGQRNFQSSNGLYSDMRSFSVGNSIEEAGRIPNNILRQNSLRESIANKFNNPESMESWMIKMAKNNRELGNNLQDFKPGMSSYDIPNGDSYIPENISSGSTAEMSAGVSSKIADASMKRVLGKNGSNIKNLFSLLSPKRFAGASEMMGNISSRDFTGFNMLNKIPGMLKPGFWGGAMRFGVNGLAGAGINYGIDAVQQHIVDNVQPGGKSWYGAQIGGLISKTAVGLKTGGLYGAVAAGGQQLSDWTKDLNQSNLDNSNSESYGGVIDMQQKLAIAQNRWKKRDAPKMAAELAKQHAADQNQISEDMANDTTHSQGKARSVLYPLLGHLGAMRQGKGLTDLSGGDKTTLQGIYNVMYPNAKKGFVNDKGEKVGFGADFGRYVSSHSDKVEQTLTNYYGKTLPTYLNDTSYTDSKGQTHTRELTSSAYPNPNGIAADRTANNGQLSQMVDLLKELANAGIDKAGINTLQQHVDFDALPINININNNAANLPDGAKNSVSLIISELQKAIQDLKDRMTKMDGVTTPSKVS